MARYVIRSTSLLGVLEDLEGTFRSPNHRLFITVRIRNSAFHNIVARAYHVLLVLEIQVFRTLPLLFIYLFIYSCSSSWAVYQTHDFENKTVHTHIDFILTI